MLEKIASLCEELDIVIGHLPQGLKHICDNIYCYVLLQKGGSIVRCSKGIDGRKLLELKSIIINSLMLCEGLDGTYSTMSDKQYVNITAGAINFMKPALERAFELMSEIEGELK